MHRGFVICGLFLCLAAIVKCDDHGNIAVSYSETTFDEAVGKRKLFVMFFAPWCGHCKRLAPTWDELAKEYPSPDSQVTIGKVDCTVETALCSKHGVRGYPTVKFFNLNTEGLKYAGARTLDALKSYVEEQLAGGEKPEEKVEEKKEPSPPAETDGLFDLTDDNFEAHVAKGHHFVKFFAPWCGHCKRLAPVWEQLAAAMKTSGKVKVAKIDCTQQQNTCSKYSIRGYPSLFWFTNGEKSEEYKNQRTLEELTKFAERLSSAEEQAAKLSKDGMVPDLKDDAETGVVPLEDDDFIESVAEDFTFVVFGDGSLPATVLLTLQKLAEKYIDTTEMLVATVDCTENKNTCNTQDAKGPFPQFKLYQDGAIVDSFKGDKTVVAMARFIDQFMDKEHDEL